MMPRKFRRRRGAALVVALVALAIAGAVSASMLKIAVLRREHLQLVERRAQADWLLQSGIQRAAARLAADPQYAGETWQPSPQAAVTIRVEPVEDALARHRLDVSARYEQAGKVVKRSRQFVLDAPTAGGRP